MSEHCCHDDCEYRIPATEVVLDTRAVAHLAWLRGVARFTTIRVVPRWRWPALAWLGIGHTKFVERGCIGSALHWSSASGAPVVRHEITIVNDITVQRMLQVVLHEIEHCLQAEQFPTLGAWDAEYKAKPAMYETLAENAESGWEELGHLIERRTA